MLPVVTVVTHTDAASTHAENQTSRDAPLFNTRITEATANIEWLLGKQFVSRSKVKTSLKLA